MGLGLTSARDAMALVMPKHNVLAPVRVEMPAIGGELADDDLQQVVGGLARTWVDDDVVTDQHDLVPADGG